LNLGRTNGRGAIGVSGRWSLLMVAQDSTWRVMGQVIGIMIGGGGGVAVPGGLALPSVFESVR
jgi:hypothetical protein